MLDMLNLSAALGYIIDNLEHEYLETCQAKELSKEKTGNSLPTLSRKPNNLIFQKD